LRALQLGVLGVRRLARVAKLVPVAALQRRRSLMRGVPIAERHADLEAAPWIVQELAARDLVVARLAPCGREVPVGPLRHRCPHHHVAPSSPMLSLPWNDGITRSRSPGNRNGRPSARSIAARLTTHRAGTSTRTYAPRSRTVTFGLSSRIA